MSTDRFRNPSGHSASKHTSEKRVTFQTADQNFQTVGQPPRFDSLTKKSSGAEGIVNALGLRSPLTNQTMQQQTSSLSKDYANRLQKMQQRLDKQIAKNVVVKDGVKVNKRRDPKDLFAKNPLQDLESQIEQDLRKKNDQIGGSSGKQDDLDLIPGKEHEGEKDTFSFIRSKEAVELKIRGGFDQDVSDIEQDKFKLVQRLNVLLGQLDKLNEDKRSLSNKLIEQIKFVRKLQSELGTADNGHITEVIDKDLEDQFRREKHLNIQLKEKLKECEEEKVRILEQLKYLEAQKDVVVVSKSGEHIDLGRAMMSVDDMIKYRHKITGDVQQIQLDLDVLRADEDQCNRSIHQLECQIREMVDEKALMYNQIKDLTIKFEDATSLINRDTHDLRYELKRQKSLLGAKVMFNALFNSSKMQKKAIFQGLRLQLKYDDRQIGSILRFRKVCIKYRRERQLKYFNLWYRYCLRPMSVVRVNREITDLSQRDAFLNQVLIRWNLKKIETETKRKHNHQKMENFFKCFRSLNSRKMRYSFSQWRRAANNITYCRQKLARFVVYRISYKMKQALFKWNTVVLHQDFHMRVHGLSVRGAVIQLKTSVFQSWVMVAKQLRKERIGLMVRTWNCLRKNRTNNKNKGQLTQLLLRQGEAMDKFYLQAALDGLRWNKTQDRFIKVNTELKHEVDTDIQSLSTSNSRQNAKATRSKNQRHMDVIVTGFGRVVFAYFKKWKDETLHYRYTMKDKFKKRVLKMYRAKLQNCFNKWNQQNVKKVKKKKFMQVETFESDKKELEAEIQKTEERIIAQTVSSQNRGHKLTKKLIYNAYKKYMKSRFDQWRIQLAEFDHKGNIIEKTIIVKMQRRILKLAFKQYVEKTKMCRKIAGGDVKGEVYREMLKFNSLKRMFNGIKKYYLKHHTAKKQFQRVYLQSDKRSKKSWFTVWKKQAFHELAEEMRNKQNEKVALIQSKANAEGSLKTTALEQEMVLKEIDKTQTSLYRKTIAKTIAQFQRYQTYEAIMRWRQRLHEYKTYQKLIKNGLIQRLMCRAQHNAFQRWRVNEAQKFKKKRKMMIQQEIQSQQDEKEQIEGVKKTRVSVTQVQSKNMIEQQEKGKYNKTKVQKVIAKITKDVNNWHYITRRKHVFNIWRDYVTNKKYFAARIAKLIAKNHHQVAFDAISQYNWELRCTEKQRRRFKKMIHVFYSRQKFGAMTRWKLQCFNHVCAVTREEQNILYHYDTNAAYDRSIKIDNIVINQARTIFQWKKKDIFIILFNYRCIKQMDRIQQEAVKAKFVMLQQRMAVQKWLARTKLTITSRQRTVCYKSIENYNKKKKVYLYFKQEWALKSKISRILNEACKVAFLDHKRHAWVQMLQRAKQNTYKMKCDQINAQKILDKVLKVFVYRRQKYYFNKYARYNRFMKYYKLNLRSIIIKQGVAKYRKVWDTWREKLNFEGVVEETHYYGKVRQETNVLKAEVKNLKMILADEGYLPKEVEKIIEDDDEYYRGQCEKTMCRWYVYGEAKERKSDLWILPWCLDKWRQYIRERKAYGHYLDFLEKRNDPNLLRKRLAFEQWTQNKPRRMHALGAKKYNELFWRNIDNATTLADQGDRMEQDQATIVDLKQQRDFLVAKVVSAQRLALDRCHFSYQFAKEKAWTKFVANSVAAMRANFNGKTLNNVQNMENLKERCKYLEKQNEVVALENDEFKKSVVKNQRLLVTADDLQRDLENLSSELSDKAVTIRKLLEDNTLMNKKLQELERANTMSSQRQQDEL